MTLITVRHAATMWSQEKRIAGRVDVPLASGAIQEAEAARTVLDTFHFDRVLSSPLSRALDTAVYCTGWPAAKITVTGGCVERDYGRLQGLSPVEVQNVRPRVRYVRVGSIRHSLNPPDGESIEQLRTRAAAFYAQVLDCYFGACVVLFSHYAFLQQFHGVLLGIDPYNALALDVRNLELSVFEFEANGAVRRRAVRRLIKGAQGAW